MQKKTTDKVSNKRSNKETEIKFKLLHPDAVLPEYAHPGDLGMDVYAVSVEYDKETDTYVYHTGVAAESNEGTGIFACARSSNCSKQCYLPNGFGVIDTATYRGEILFKYKNRTSLGSQIEHIALGAYYTLPWYVRLFTKYEEVLNRTAELVDPMKYAPYEVGDKIGQFIVMNFPKVVCTKTDILSETERGEGGFGSTDKKKKSNKKTIKE